MSVPIDFEWGKWCLHLFLVTMNSVFIKLTGNEVRHKILVRISVVSDQSFWSFVLLSGKKKLCLQLFSVIFDWILQVTRTGRKARMSSNLGQIGLFTLELFALEHGFFFPQTYNGENKVSTFYQLPWVQSSSNSQVTRTGMKCWMGSNSSRI